MLSSLSSPQIATPPEGQPVYRAYGLNVASGFPFGNRLGHAAGPPDLLFECVGAPPEVTDPEDGFLLYRSRPLPDSGASYFTIYRHDRFDVMRFRRIADYYIWPEKIICHLLDPFYRYAVEILLLSDALSYWLERRGIAALHAASVAIGGQAVAFLATNKGGKSSLAASLMKLGHPLLTDDILPIERRGEEFLARPGYPQMRMWPEQARHFVGGEAQLEQVHPYLDKRRVPVGNDGLGSFCATPQPLTCLYLPDRHDYSMRPIEITPLSLKEAITTLLAHSFMAGIVEAAQLEEARFRFFAQLLQAASVRKLSYPNGLGRLPEVAAAIVADVRQ